MNWRTVEKLHKVASIYRNAIRAKEPPVHAVAQHFRTSHTYAANLVTKARHAGLLEHTTKGRKSTVLDKRPG